MDYSKENYITRDPNIKEWESHLNSMILLQYSDILTGDVVDFGCNHGACTIIAARNKNIKSMTGIDINPNSIEIAKKLVSSCEEETSVKQKLNYFVENLISLENISDNQFDSAFSFHTLEHIYPEDLDLVLYEWKRVIKKEGHIVVSVPYLYAYNDTCHVNFFDEESLSKLFSKNGFFVKESYRDQRENFDCLNLVCQVKK